MYKKGFYTPSGGFVYYGTDEHASLSANFMFIQNKYYVVLDKENNTRGILNMPDGYSFEVDIVRDKYFVLSNGITISDTGKIGYMDGDNFVVGRKPHSREENSDNVHRIKTYNNSYIDLNDEYGYFLSDGTFVLYSGGYGYYEKDKMFIENALNPYINGFYNFEGKWVSIDDKNDVPNKGYFNRYGIPRNGDSPYNIGYYDYEGSLHPFEKTYFITIDGNVVQIGENAIGYINSLGLFFMYDDEGYFDVDGTYYVGTELKGYYTKDGVLTKGKNPNFDGFYDMKGNWHLFGDKGYFDSSGYYHESVTDERVGYFNEVGEFTDGYNPYINGYNDINGNWNDIATTPLTLYYEKDGTARVGLPPYKFGYYDMYANWHPFGYKGYFDKHGTYYSISNGNVGYYDEKGNYREGTNPYQHGYYDENANLRLFEHPGYFTKNGTFVDEGENQWYFLSDKLKKRGENTNPDGFYDMYGNWYPFEENGYYTPEKLFFPTLLVVDKYRVGSDNYILFEGIFNNPEYVPSTSKNTIQFTFNGNSGAPLFVDTGIRVSKNAMISYSNARDLLHNIAVYSKSTFIDDNDSCLVIVDGRVINLTNNGKMSIKELRDKFLDSNIEITIARTRIGERFALADSIESGNNIRIYKDNVPYAIRNPLIVENGTPYIALKDLSELIVYDIKTNKVDDKRVVTFTLKQNLSQEQYSSLMKEIVTEIGNRETLVNVTKDEYSYYQLKAPIITKTMESTGIEEIYVPIYMIGRLTGMNVEYNTLTYALMLTPQDNELPFEDN
jgi:hypothetical protein